MLAEQRAIVLKNERPVLAGSVDALHDLRVALRRIRCLAATFVKLDRKKLTDLDRQLAEVCDAVGLARDLDVWGDLFRRLLRTGGLQQITR
ncbi:MAG TPA: CHAD domain-containing protein, partial [Kiritimatiellia bacterium]|nr:CHAD domain-containing protein [Kiritimatiellia bacterium]